MKKVFLAIVVALSITACGGGGGGGSDEGESSAPIVKLDPAPVPIPEPDPTSEIDPLPPTPPPVPEPLMCDVILPSSVDINTLVNFTATINGGSGVKTYEWSLGGPVIEPADMTTPTIEVMYSAGGSFSVNMTVTDDVDTCTVIDSISVVDTTPPPPGMPLSWTIPTTRTPIVDEETGEEVVLDLPLDEIFGYWAYFGREPGVYTKTLFVTENFATSIHVTDLPAGTWYVAMSTIDTMDNEGPKCPDVEKTAY